MYSNRTESELGILNVLNSFPYIERSDISDPNFDPNNFSINLTANDGWTFADPNNNVAACDVKNTDENIRRNYYVKGLYPACDGGEGSVGGGDTTANAASTDPPVECLNFNIVYSDEEDVPTTLEDFKNDPNSLPIVNIFEDGLATDNIEDYKNALYYFRRFKNEDGLDEIEAQIRCDRDINSQFHCRITEHDLATEYCESLPLIAGRGDGCNGSNRIKKTADEISSIPLEQIQEAQDAGEGDTKFRSPCCKWHNITPGLVSEGQAQFKTHSNTDFTILDTSEELAILPSRDLTDYLNTTDKCSLNDDGIMAWFEDDANDYNCVPVTVTVRDSNQAQGEGYATISMIMGRNSKTCRSTGDDRQPECICPQRENGDFMTLQYADRYWDGSEPSQRHHTRCV